MRPVSIICIVAVSFATFMQCASAEGIEVRGQVSGWLTIDDVDSTDVRLGLRYIPEMTLETTIGEGQTLTGFASFDMFATAEMYTANDFGSDADADLYRLWLRFGTSQFEARVGLQKINFGSATLLRPLMWFDQIDSRDPLRLTDGVYGLLLRYYFVNNANVWLWGLYGNDDPRGWDVLVSDDESPELGGRVQAPLGNGEVGVSYHHRRVDFGATLGLDTAGFTATAAEDRLGLDGKFDIGVGAWFEAMLLHQDGVPSAFTWRRAANIGIDYTFGVGNGLNAIGEHFVFGTSEEAFGSGSGIDMSAVSVSYPLGLVNSVSAMVYYHWDNDAWYRLVDWRQTYDNWSFHLIGFYNPEATDVYGTGVAGSSYSGKGLQLMAVYNH